MGRITIITGNGLGMALDSTAFSLEGAIRNVWERKNRLMSKPVLTPEQKDLVGRCLPSWDRKSPPVSEDDLDKLHQTLVACDFLTGIESGPVHWLSEEGKKFPAAIRKFIHEVASSFHLASGDLPEGFVGPLSKFVKETKSHVATLNYDNLLYNPLCEKENLNGYEGDLVDGIWAGEGFRLSHMERKYGRDFGYYLHLHGSPLFVEQKDGSIKKNPSVVLRVGDNPDGDSRHIVLTHVMHKLSVIRASEILSCYWDLLRIAIKESEGVTLLGYSGCDTHLNHLIRDEVNRKKTLRLRVVEWEGAGEGEDRVDFWEDKLGGRPEVISLPSVLEFDDWRHAGKP